MKSQCRSSRRHVAAVSVVLVSVLACAAAFAQVTTSRYKHTAPSDTMVPTAPSKSATSQNAAPEKGNLRRSETLRDVVELQTITSTVPPDAFLTATEVSIKRGGVVNMTGDPAIEVPYGNVLFAGYLHDTNGHDSYGTGYEARNEFYRAGLHFNVASLAGRTVRKAVLKLRVYASHHRGVHSNPDTWDHFSTCGTTLASGRSQWWKGLPGPQSIIDVGPPTLPLGPNETSDMEIDVTDMVRAWVATPNANYGFVLVGDNEDQGAYTETICQTQYVHNGDGAPTLTISYY